MIEESLTKQINYRNIGIYFIALRLLLLFLIMWRYRRWWGRTYVLQVLPENGVFPPMNNFPVELLSFTIAYVDPNIPRMSVGETNMHLFWYHGSVDDDSILLIMTSILNITIHSIKNNVIAGLSDPSRIIEELCGCRKKPNWDDILHTHNVTPIFHNNTAARWVNAAKKLHNSMLFCVVCRSQRTSGTAGAHIPTYGGHS